MGLQVGGGYCEECRRNVRVERQGINHILHLLLSLITFGVWLLVWGYQGFKARPWICTRCGATVPYLSS